MEKAILLLGFQPHPLTIGGLDHTSTVHSVGCRESLTRIVFAVLRRMVCSLTHGQTDGIAMNNRGNAEDLAYIGDNGSR